MNPQIILKIEKHLCNKRSKRHVFKYENHQSGASPCENVNLFIEWYKHYFDNDNFRKNLKHKDVLHVKFKDFVLNLIKKI